MKTNAKKTTKKMTERQLDAQVKKIAKARVRSLLKKMRPATQQELLALAEVELKGLRKALAKLRALYAAK